MSKKTVWRKGPPPSIGWWPANAIRAPELLSWWDGKLWSFAAINTDSLEEVGKAVDMKRGREHLIEWTDRPDNWPPESYT